MKRLLLSAFAIANWGFIALASEREMSVAQQNQLVHKYCAVCHTDAFMNGGLSLEHFDTAHSDPGEVAMVISKMKGGAFGAAGIPVPDKDTRVALLDALSAKTVGADRWVAHPTNDPATNTPIFTASLVQQTPSAKNAAVTDLYRLTLTCRPDTHQATMQLSWSPDVPENGKVISVSVDGNTPVAHTVEGSEKFGNGMAGTSGPGATLLPMPLPQKTLTVSNLFPNETIVFPFDGLTQTARDAMSTCFTSRTIR